MCIVSARASVVAANGTFVSQLGETVVSDDVVWVERQADQGQFYYYHKLTKESTWEPPSALILSASGRVIDYRPQAPSSGSVV
jgi:hypothetical protein